MTGKKTWDDQNDKDQLRPDSITVRLYADGKEIDHVKVVPDSAGSWKWSFKGLPAEGKNGKKIVYTVKEDAVKGYTAKVDGWNITNQHKPSDTPKKKTATPSTPATPRNNTTTPKTGDESRMGLYVILMAGSALLLVLLIGRRRKKEKE